MKNLAFLTLFLGIVWGRPLLEMEAVDGTVRIEVRLDGEVASVVTGGPPWKSPVELGDDVAPHHLEAIAYDADGRELGRAEQWLNVPRALAEVQILLDHPERLQGDSGARSPGRVEGATARVRWTAVRHSVADRVTATFDGEPLEVGPDGRITLPPFDPRSLHVLGAEVTFPDDSTARADMAFGGRYSEAVATELTSVPVTVDRPRRLREAGDAGPWLQRDGRPLPVVAVDSGPVDLFAVIDLGSELQRQLVAVGMARRMGDPGARVVRYRDTATGYLRYRAVTVRNFPSPMLLSSGMRPGDLLHLVRPQLEPRDDGLRLFSITRTIEEKEMGSAWRLAYVHRTAPDPAVPQRLADAVATVGVWAAGRSRPRAVLLVLGPDAEDGSELDPSEARRFLRRLGVPLAVAYVELEAPEYAEEVSRDQRLAAARELWGPEVADVADAADWIRFHDQLRERLDHQRLLWVRGRHLPQEIGLAPGAPSWLSLVGRGGGR